MSRRKDRIAMPSLPRLAAMLGLCAGLGLAAAPGAGAAGGRLYPSGPPHGVAYLRFANLTMHQAKVASAAAELTLPTDDPHRAGQYDPVTPGSELAGSVVLDGKSKPIDLKLTPNEFMTIVITAGTDGGPAITPLHETPTDFNAQKSSIVLYNLDQGCKAAKLVAGPQNVAVISGVAPDALGRRLVNPVNVSLAVACGDAAPAVPVKLGQMAAGERYSVFLFNRSGAGRQALAVRDEMAPFRP